LAAAGKPIPDEDLITYLTNGLNPSFNGFITSFSIMTRDKTLSLEDFQDELLNHETLLNHQQTKAVDTSTYALLSHKPNPRHFSPKPRGPPYPKFPSKNYDPRFDAAAPTQRYNAVPPPARYSAPSRYSSPSRQPAYRAQSAPNNRFPAPPGPRTPCQICGKLSHSALDCYHRMDHAFQGRHPPHQLHAMAAHSPFVDQEWFADSAANAHITHDLNNLQVQQPFQHPKTTTLSSSQSDFLLKNVMHCPNAATNLVSIQRFCLDNHCYFILTASHFYIIDLQTQAILLEGKSENGMYPLQLGKKSHRGSKAFTAKQGIKTTPLVWHFRLGLPSSDVVTRVVKENKLPVSDLQLNKESVCASCQMGKAKKLPFNSSNRTSTSPLQLIHSNLWTSPVQSMSGYKYYALFVDDFSRFSWIYPLHAKSDTFSAFVQFKALVENQFSTTIKQLQTDGGGEYNSHQVLLTSTYMALYIEKVVHIPLPKMALPKGNYDIFWKQDSPSLLMLTYLTNIGLPRFSLPPTSSTAYLQPHSITSLLMRSYTTNPLTIKDFESLGVCVTPCCVHMAITSSNTGPSHAFS